MVEHVIRNDGVLGSSPISGTSAPIGGAGVFGLETKFACNFGDDGRAIHFDPGGHGVLGVSETLCKRVSPCGFDGSFVEPFWI